MFHWYQIWKHMRKKTGREIEKRAIMEIINYFEKQINAVIDQSILEQDRINKFRIAQSLEPKSRIDEKCVRNAINTINSELYSSLPKKAGGMIKKRKKNYERHLKDSKSLMEVV